MDKKPNELNQRPIEERDPDRKAAVQLTKQRVPEAAREIPGKKLMAAFEEEAAREEEKAPRKLAVLVAHGMGQQLPFETLKEVAASIWDEAGRNHITQRSLAVGFAMVAGERLPRVEMKLQPGRKPEQEVHFYEAYWAPLTEGKVTTRDAFQFLLGAAWAGIQESWARNRFRRWMFNQWQPFAVHPSVLIATFLAAAGVLLSLALINSAIVAVAASSSLTSTWKGWPSVTLRQDLTVDLAVTEAVLLLLLGLGVVVPMVLQRTRSDREEKRVPEGYLFFARGMVYAAVVAVIAAGGLVLFHLYLHRPLDVGEWWQRWPALTHAPEAMTRVLIGLVVLSVLKVWIARTWESKSRKAVLAVKEGAGGAISQMQLWPGYAKLAKFTVVVVSSVVAAVVLWILLYPWMGGSEWACLRVVGRFVKWVTALLERPGIQSGVIWASAVGASLFVRSFVRQYVGDVAAYISAHKVSAFAEIRQKIQETTLKVFSAVYKARRSDTGLPEYDQIVVVGHSLGSVIAYDALNSLLVDDQLAGGKDDVAGRTRALVTFGSPLDKTAYVFRTQISEPFEVREALAAARQPMIINYNFRPREWVNLYSPEDWISGPLDYYDDDRPVENLPAQKNGGPQRIQNLRDPEACVPLAAHTQYWGNRLLAQTLYRLIL